MSDYDPATRADKLKSLIYLTAMFGLIIVLLVSYCISRHGM